MNNAIKNILIPLDFTRKNEKFLNIAAAVANRHGAKVHVLNVIPFSLLGTGSVSSGNFFFHGNAMIESAEKQLATYKMVMRKITNEDVIAQHAIGSVATQVLKYSKQKNIDLILMPVRYPKRRPGFISSNTYEIIANSAVPVMTIPENFNKEKFEKILFPIRNVKAVEDKLQSVIPIAKNNKANVRLVAIDAFERKSSIRNLENKVQLLGEKLHNSEISTIKEDLKFSLEPHKDILAIGDENNSDLIAVNVSTEKSFTQLFKNNFTENIVYKSKRPVLFFPKEEEATPAQEYVAMPYPMMPV